MYRGVTGLCQLVYVAQREGVAHLHSCKEGSYMSYIRRHPLINLFPKIYDLIDIKPLPCGMYSEVPQCPGCLWPFPQLFVRQVCGERQQTAGLSIFRLYWSPHISSLFMHRHEHNRFPYSNGCRGNWVPIMRSAIRSHLQTSTFSLWWCGYLLYIPTCISKYTQRFSSLSYLNMSLCAFEWDKCLTG